MMLGGQIMELKRWTASRKAEVVLDILRGKTAVVDFCRGHDLSQGEVDRWVDDFVRGGTGNLKAVKKKDESDRQLDDLKKVVGEQALQILVLKKVPFS